jgi:hypothetical protein
MPAEHALDPVGDPDATRQALNALAACGTTALSARFVHRSLEHYLEQLHALTELNDRETG